MHRVDVGRGPRQQAGQLDGPPRQRGSTQVDAGEHGPTSGCGHGRSSQGSQRPGARRTAVPYARGMGELIPLFPLGTPLFPGVVAAAAVFEPRYRRLVQRPARLPDGDRAVLRRGRHPAGLGGRGRRAGRGPLRHRLHGPRAPGARPARRRLPVVTVGGRPVPAARRVGPPPRARWTRYLAEAGCEWLADEPRPTTRGPRECRARWRRPAAGTLFDGVLSRRGRRGDSAVDAEAAALSSCRTRTRPRCPTWSPRPRCSPPRTGRRCSRASAPARRLARRVPAAAPREPRCSADAGGRAGRGLRSPAAPMGRTDPAVDLAPGRRHGRRAGRPVGRRPAVSAVDERLEATSGVPGRAAAVSRRQASVAPPAPRAPTCI